VNAASAGDSLVVILFADYQLLDQDLSGDFSVDSPTFYVDSTNNRVGVGTATPSTAILDIFTGSTTADGLKINRFATGVYYSTLRQDAHGLAIHVGDGSTISERVAITPNGITFNGDTAAANALDDYEEGTWTPTITGGASSVSYSIQVGYYIKVGGLVHFGLDLNITSATADANGIEISDLPFTNNPSTSQYFSAASVSYTSGFIDGPSRGFFHISHNSTVIRLYNYAGNHVAGNATGIDMSNRIILTGTYNTL